jgi:hypothetical protein
VWRNEPRQYLAVISPRLLAQPLILLLQVTTPPAREHNQRQCEAQFEARDCCVQPWRDKVYGLLVGVTQRLRVKGLGLP